LPQLSRLSLHDGFFASTVSSPLRLEAIRADETARVGSTVAQDN